jgi:hypothetical protein
MPEKYRLRREALEWREVEGEVVAADTRSSLYLSVNAAGAVLWPALAEGTTEDALVDRLIEAYGLDRERARHDVARFLEGLRGQGLLAT